MDRLDLISSDCRMARLFDKQYGEYCILEMWLMQLKQKEKIETRMIYAHILPFTYSNNKWSARREDHFEKIDEYEVQLLKVSLYFSVDKTKKLIEMFCQGDSIKVISNELQLEITEKFIQRFGTVPIFNPRNITIQPILHLPSSSFYKWKLTHTSLVDRYSVDNASIINLKKDHLFDVDNTYSEKLANYILEKLKDDTNIDFSKYEIPHLGNLELLVFPWLDEKARQLFYIKDSGDRKSIILHLNPHKSLLNSIFSISIKLLHDEKICCMRKWDIEIQEQKEIELEFEIPEIYLPIRDKIEIEIWNIYGDSTFPSYLWAYPYIRHANIGTIINEGEVTVQDDWLAEGVHNKDKQRVNKVSKIARQNTHLGVSKVGGRIADSWINIDQRLQKKIYPDQSKNILKGGFFKRYQEEGGTGRLELAEWLRNLFKEYPNHEIFWYDPYMEDVGITLLNIFADNASNYTIITASSETKADRIKNLKQTCDSWEQQYGNPTLRVVGNSPDDLHDRMILIRNKNKTIIVGYHLSNSIQNANKNFPLLITPIPMETLQQVDKYINSTISNSHDTIWETTARDIPSLETLTHDAMPDKDIPYLADIYVWWTNNGRSIESIEKDKDLMKALRDPCVCLSDNEKAPAFDEIPDKLWTEPFPVNDFEKGWSAFTHIFDKIHCNNYGLRKGVNFPPPHKLSSDLYQYINSYSSKNSDSYKNQAYSLEPIIELLKESSPSLFESWAYLERVFPFDVGEISWEDECAINALWNCDPHRLIQWMEESIKSKDLKSINWQLQIKCALRIIVSEVGFLFYVSEIEIIEEEISNNMLIQALLNSNLFTLRWIAYYKLIDLVLDKKLLLETAIALIKKDKLSVIAWWVTRAKEQNDENYKNALGAWFSELSKSSNGELSPEILNDFSIPLKDNFFTEQWFFDEVMLPLINDKSINYDLYCSLWIDKMIACWDDICNGVNGFSFNAVFTNNTTKLLELSSEQQQIKLFKKLKQKINSMSGILRQPLAYHQKWNLFNNNWKSMLWATSFLKKVQESGIGHLSDDIESIIKIGDDCLSYGNEYEWTNEHYEENLKYYKSLK